MAIAGGFGYRVSATFLIAGIEVRRVSNEHQCLVRPEQHPKYGPGLSSQETDQLAGVVG
jgi:hypothetical protein